MTQPVVIVEYDPEWPIIYEEEKERVLDVVGDKLRVIEHFGSTAVPGLSAKPIIDIMAGVKDQTVADQCLPPLAEIGYIDVTPQPDEKDWFYCLGKRPHSVGFHLHLVRHSSDFWKRHIVFRDYLRNDNDVAQRYNNLKKRLAEKYRTDRLGYCEAKTEFIESVLASING